MRQGSGYRQGALIRDEHDRVEENVIHQTSGLLAVGKTDLLEIG